MLYAQGLLPQKLRKFRISDLRFQIGEMVTATATEVANADLTPTGTRDDGDPFFHELGRRTRSVGAAFALWMGATAIDVRRLFHCFALGAAVLFAGDHAGAIGMSALFRVGH
jgi:hypothetical protein